MPLDKAVALWRDDLFEEFEWVDKGRSQAIVISGALTFYAQNLLSPMTTRPCFVVLKNAPGAGATTVGQLMFFPVLGNRPVLPKPESNDEVRKTISACVRAGDQLIFFDNVCGFLKSAALDAFLTGPQWSDRLLGATTKIEGPNLAVVIITGNGLTLSPDLMRRSLISEVHQSYAIPGERKYKRSLDPETLETRRPEMLSALWAFVQHWASKLFPRASRSNSAFVEWGEIVGGIAEAAGFACPLAPSESNTVLNEDLADMIELVTHMTGEYTFKQLVYRCSELEIFPNLTGDVSGQTDSQRSTLGKIFASYNGVVLGDRRFTITGNPKSRRSRHYSAVLISDQQS